MIHRIATINTHRTGPFLFQAGLVGAVAGVAGLIGLSRLLNGHGVVGVNLALMAPGLILLRGLFGQLMVFIQAQRQGRPALWIEGDRLVYLSPLYASLPVNEVVGVEQRLGWGGFGQQPYAVISSRRGRKIYVMLPLITESPEHLKEMITEIAAG